MSARSSSRDEALAQRIRAAMETVRAWEETDDLLAECRARLPWAALRDPAGPFSSPEDAGWPRSVQFLQRLARYFKSSMTWINQPPCQYCGQVDTMMHQTTRGPETVEEIEGQASRVEVYLCPNCPEGRNVTTFPRYNAVRTLMETRQGRCGEYANLMGLTCRAVGWETRYILDMTDHVWVEVYIEEAAATPSPTAAGSIDASGWIMVDGCEGVIAEPSMYEAGWGKKLSYIVAVAIDHVVDVTARYTRSWPDADLIQRRRAVTSSEVAGQQIIEQWHQEMMRRFTATHPKSASPYWRETLQRRLALEKGQLEGIRARPGLAWDKAYRQGRISGSVAWKAARREDGSDVKESGGKDMKDQQQIDKSSSIDRFPFETFFPKRDTVSVTLHPQPTLRHEAIVVSGAACAIGEPNTLSVVVLDEVQFGGILQSRLLTTLPDLAAWIKNVPPLRVVIIHGRLPHTTDPIRLEDLPGFDSSMVQEGVMYIGQVLAKPDWCYCSTWATAPPDGVHLVAAIALTERTKDQSDANEWKLSTKRNATAASVVGRVPETIMPLQTQMMANHQQKRLAFLSMLQKSDTSYSQYCGYTTKSGLPIYLLGESAYPLEYNDGSVDEAWHTFVLLPAHLVDSADENLLDTVPAPASFDIPLDSNFFHQEVGTELLVKHGGQVNNIATVAALNNVRLVGLYFSAHWCGPCRSFTPMLAEMYDHLKKERPTHGLEIVFVSSDHDVNSFNRYYNSMPWLAIPFQNLPIHKQLLSMKYGVQGIPSLVILDALSGSVVVPATTSRRDVMEACRGGDEAITKLLDRWLEMTPAESKEMVEMLRQSCVEEVSAPETQKEENPYLIRKSQLPPTKQDVATQIKSKFAELVASGMAPNHAAAKAIEIVTSQSNDTTDGASTSPLEGRFKTMPLPDPKSRQEDCVQRVLAGPAGPAALQAVLTTILKYLENVRREPWNPRYRHFRLSNKVADRITSVEHGCELMVLLGLHIYSTSQDFVATFPLDADLDSMHTCIAALLEQNAPVAS